MRAATSDHLNWMSEEEAADHAKWKGNCYEASAKYVLSKQGEGAVLVHGMPVFKGNDPEVPKGSRFGHAWVERDGIVYDLTMKDGHLGIPRPLYYLLGGLTTEGDDDSERVTYSRKSIVLCLTKHAHWGPWTGSEAWAPKTTKKKTNRKGK